MMMMEERKKRLKEIARKEEKYGETKGRLPATEGIEKQADMKVSNMATAPNDKKHSRHSCRK